MTDFSGIETIQFKQGTAAAWTTVNPTLLAGEPGVESDTGKFKIGNGTNAWIDLPYGGFGGTWASVVAAPDFPASLAYGNTDAAARAEIGALGTDGWAALVKPAYLAAGTTAEAARDAIDALGTPDLNVPGGVPGLDPVTGLIDIDQLPAGQDLSDYATLEDLGVPIDQVADPALYTDADLSAALASVPSDKGVVGFIAVKVAGS